LKKIAFLIVISGLFLISCAAPRQGSTSTVPWDDHRQLDSLSTEYVQGEEDVIYN
jgi:hypothetical protein